MTKLLEKILNNVSLDERVSDGIFDVCNPSHMDVMREYLTARGIDDASASEFCKLVTEKGRFPEKQAYNKNGILTTFPSAAYKARAISKGTHFEQDPTKGKPNVFGAPPPEAAGGEQPAPPPKQGADAQAAPQGPSDDPTTPSTPPAATPEAPAATPAPTAPAAAPAPAPQPQAAPKFPQEKEADKDFIKKIIASNDNVLNEVVNILMDSHSSWVATKVMT